MTNNVDLNGRQPDALIEIQVTGEVLPPSGSEGNILARRNGKNAWTDPSDLSLVAVKTSASVGQTIVVKAVDADGKPIEWETADMSSGGAVSSVNGKIGDVVLVASDIKHGYPRRHQRGVRPRQPQFRHHRHCKRPVQRLPRSDHRHDERLQRCAAGFHRTRPAAR